VSLCESPVEDVKLALYRVRSRIWDSQYAEAMRLLKDVLKRVGYDPERPELLRLKVPRTLAEVETFRAGLQDIPYDEDSDVRILLSTLICKWTCLNLRHVLTGRCGRSYDICRLAQSVGHHLLSGYHAIGRNWNHPRVERLSYLCFCAQFTRCPGPTHVVRLCPIIGQ